MFQEVQKRFPDGVPLLDPIDDMGIQDQGLKKVIQKVEAFEHRMYSHPLHNDPNLETVYTLCEKKAQVWQKHFYHRILCISLYERVYIFCHFIFLLVSSAKAGRCVAINSYQQKKVDHSN